MWDFFLNKFIKTSHASPVQWRFTMASRLNVRNFRISSRWGSSCFKDGKSGVSSILSWVPFSTRKHQWAVFSSCVNWLGNLSSDEGNTNENATWKCKWLLFYLCYLLALPLTSTETANYPITKVVGVALKLRKLNGNLLLCVHVLNKALNLVISFWCFAEHSKGMYRNLKHMCETVIFAHLTFCVVAFSLLSLMSLLTAP